MCIRDRLDILPGKVPDEALEQIRGFGIKSFSGVCLTGAHWDTDESTQANIKQLHQRFDEAAEYGEIVAGPILRGFAVDIDKKQPVGGSLVEIIESTAQGIAKAITSYTGKGIKWILAEMLNSRENNGMNDLVTCLKVCKSCLLYTSPSPRDRTRSRMPSSA